MRYISSLAGVISVDNIEEYGGYFDSGFYGDVEVTDLDTGDIERVRDVIAKDAIGTGYDSYMCRWCAVEHTHKTALLHKYIEWAETDVYHDIRPLPKADRLYYGTNIMEREDSDTLDIIMGDYRVVLCGAIRGSVVVWRGPSPKQYQLGCGQPVFMTLYDMLIKLCRYTKVNVFQYREIQFSSAKLRWYSYLKFKQTDEARRFLTKMYMEACIR